MKDSNLAFLAMEDKVQATLIMPACKILVSEKHWRARTPALVLFDTGASRSFVSDNFCNKAAIHCRHDIATMNVAGVNSNFMASKAVDLVTHSNHECDRPVPLQAIIVPTIGSIDKVNFQPPSHWGSFKLQDFPHGQLDIDVLIGQDHFWQFIGSFTKIQRNLIKLNSIYGQILSGYVCHSELDGISYSDKHQDSLHFSHVSFALLGELGKKDKTNNLTGNTGSPATVTKLVEQKKSLEVSLGSEQLDLEDKLHRYLGYESLGLKLMIRIS